MSNSLQLCLLARYNCKCTPYSVIHSATEGGVWQVTLSMSVHMSAPTLYLTHCLLTVTDFLSRGAVTSRTPCTCEFMDFNIGVADDSFSLGCNAVSLENQISIFRRKIQP
jgi:hypothetical protein